MSDRPSTPLTSTSVEENEVAPPLGRPDPLTSISPEAEEPPLEQPPVRVVDKRWWAREETGGDEEGSTKPSYVEELERQLADKDELLKSYAAKYKEAAQEFEQTRDRVRREVTKDIEREKRNVLAAFLDVIDNLDRAIEAGQSHAVDSALLKGVELVRQQFLATLDGYGVTPIEASGEAFDPTSHDALSTVAVDDIALDNVVIDVVKVGYRVGDEVLRPVSVTVGKHEGPDEESAS